jgi:hypothetical protein
VVCDQLLNTNFTCCSYLTVACASSATLLNVHETMATMLDACFFYHSTYVKGSYVIVSDDDNKNVLFVIDTAVYEKHIVSFNF